MVYSFDEPTRPERHDLQYFEMAGNRGIYYKGWSAVTRHSTPWLPNEAAARARRRRLGALRRQHRLDAGPRPGRGGAGAARGLQRLWLIEAVKYNVLPIDDRRFERLNATIAGRPQLITGTTQVLFPGMKRLSENSVIDIKNRSFSVTASIETRAKERAKGVIIAQGGRFGGWALYVKDGRAKFVYNVLGMQEFVTEATRAAPGRQPPGAGRVRLRRRRPREGRRPSRCTTTAALSAPDASNVTQPLIFSADETTDIGDDYGMPVSADYAGASKFNGRIDVVQIDVGDDDHSHLIDPEEVARIATARQ